MTDTTLTYNPASATAYILRLQKVLADYQAAKDKTQNAVEPDPYDKEPPHNVPSLSQSTSDVNGDSIQNARPVGELTGGKTRLNVLSALTKNDPVDYYSFKFTKSGHINFSITQSADSDGKVAVQILGKGGKIIADSQATSGALYDNYQAITTGTFNLDAGTYYVKLSREAGTLNTTKPNYAFQLNAGRYYEKDYQTIESPVAQVSGYYTSSSTLAAAGVSTVLSSIFTNSASGTQYGGTLLDALL